MYRATRRATGSTCGRRERRRLELCDPAGYVARSVPGVVRRSGPGDQGHAVRARWQRRCSKHVGGSGWAACLGDRLVPLLPTACARQGPGIAGSRYTLNVFFDEAIGEYAAYLCALFSLFCAPELDKGKPPTVWAEIGDDRRCMETMPRCE